MTGKHWIAIPSLIALGAALLLQGPTVTSAAGPAGPAGPAEILGADASLYDLKGGTGVQVLNFGAGTTDVTLRLQDSGGGDPTDLQQPAVPANAVTNFYLPSQTSVNSAYFSGLASAQGQSVDAIFRSDWQPVGKSVMGRAPTADVDLIVPLFARLDGITGRFLFVQNGDTDHVATITLDVRVAGGQQPGRRRLRLTLAAGGATMIDMRRHPALQDLIPDGASWTGWVRLSSDRPIAAMAMSDVEGSAGAYILPGLAPSERSAQLAAPMVYRKMPENEGPSSSGFLDSAIHVLNPGDAPVTVTVRYTVSSGNAAACPAGREVVHGGQSQTLAPGEVKVYHQGLTTTGDSGLPDGCAASARIEASAPVAAAVDVSNELGLVAAYPAYPVALANATLRLPLVRREHTPLQLTTLIQVQNPGDRPVTVNLRYTYGYSNRLAECPSDCTVTLAAGASHSWDPRQIATWLPNSYGSAVIEADGPVTAVVLDDSTSHRVDLAAYSAAWDSGRQVAPLPMLTKDASLGSLTQPDLEPITAAALGISMRPPRDASAPLPTNIRLICGSGPLRRVVLHFIYDASWLGLDETDSDGDAVPDAISARLPAGARLTQEHGVDGREGRLTLVLEGGGATGMLTGTIDMGVALLPQAAPGAAAFGFDIDPKREPELSGFDGRPVMPDIAGAGWKPGGYHEAYLPSLSLGLEIGRR